MQCLFLLDFHRCLNILLLKSVPMTHPQISNEIMYPNQSNKSLLLCPNYPYMQYYRYKTIDSYVCTSILDDFFFQIFFITASLQKFLKCCSITVQIFLFPKQIIGENSISTINRDSLYSVVDPVILFVCLPSICSIFN